MSLWRDKRLDIRCDSTGAPRELHLNYRIFRVSHILDCWNDTGCWWEGEKEKVFYRISCESGPVCEIFREIGGNAWFLYKVYD